MFIRSSADLPERATAYRSSAAENKRTGVSTEILSPTSTCCAKDGPADQAAPIAEATELSRECRFPNPAKARPQKTISITSAVQRYSLQ